MATKLIVPWETADEGFVLPKGKCVVKIVGGAFGETQSGRQKVDIDFLALAPKNIRGRKVRVMYAFTSPGLRELRELVTAVLGSTPKKAGALDLQQLFGKVLVAESVHVDGNQGGKFQKFVNMKLHSSQPEPEPEDEDDLDDDGDLDLDGDDDLSFDL